MRAQRAVKCYFIFLKGLFYRPCNQKKFKFVTERNLKTRHPDHSTRVF